MKKPAFMAETSGGTSLDFYLIFAVMKKNDTDSFKRKGGHFRLGRP
jgi:hypothetical protein